MNQKSNKRMINYKKLLNNSEASVKQKKKLYPYINQTVRLR